VKLHDYFNAHLLDAGVIRFDNKATYPSYYPALQTLKAENLTQITGVISAATSTTLRNITIKNMSFKNCANLASMTLGGYYQTTPGVTINIVGTPLVEDFPNSITDYDTRYSFIITE
jgi:hypothetical protein